MEINDNKQLILLFSYHLFISGFGFRQISGIRCVSIWIFPYICNRTSKRDERWIIGNDFTYIRRKALVNYTVANLTL